jgi:23S rRNA (adenine2503-C2)-methyltransferase
MNTELQKTNLLDLNEQGLLAFFVEWGEKPFRARQVLKWIHKFGISDFEDMTDLSKVLRARLAKECEIKGPEISEEFVSKDGTRKWLMRIEGGSLIETVYIPEESRGTLCVSSQVGCALNCTFCSTATQGFNRNLSVAEIIGQVRLARQRLKALSSDAGEDSDDFFEITNIVMMGMGEPLLNYDNVIKAMSLMRHDEAYALPRRRVTLSTSGVVPNIERLEQDADVSLALSLHAPNDPLRNILVPINKKYPIEVLLNACKRYVSKNHRYKITIEYVLLRGVNDTVALAKQLAALLKQVPCKINLIPFNPFPGADYERSYPEDIIAFKDILMQAGYVVTVRKTRGHDIAAACGQLVGKVIDRTQRQEKFNIKVQNKKAQKNCETQGAEVCS